MTEPNANVNRETVDVQETTSQLKGKSTKGKPQGEVIPPAKSSDKASETGKDETVTALMVTVNEDMTKREDAMDNFLAELPKAQANDIRKETKAFLSDIRAAAGKVTSAIVHLYNVHKALSDDELFLKYSRALVSEGHVTAGTLYTLTKKIEVFESLELPEPARAAIMSYSGGDSIIVRRALTPGEIKTWKEAHPGSKAPKGVYEPSPYFQRACEVVEYPQKWSQDSADLWAGRALRLAAKLRGKDRSGKSEDGARGDAKKAERFEALVSKLEIAITGEPTEKGIKGMVVLSDKDMESDMLTDAAEIVVKAVCQRLPLAVLNSLYETIDQTFIQQIARAEKSELKKTAKAS